MGPTDRVIIVTHEPNWILDPYLGEKTGTTSDVSMVGLFPLSPAHSWSCEGQNLSYLMDVVLANRVALRLVALA